MNEQSAFFVEHPKTIESLRRPHFSEQRRRFVVEKKVYLTKIRYENFISDMCIRRQFLERHSCRCGIDENGICHCILVMQKGRTDGILVMSGESGIPECAAYLPNNG